MKIGAATVTDAVTASSLRVLLAGVVLLPLAVAPNAFVFPFVTTKALLLQALAAGLLAVLALRWATSRRGAARPDATLWALAGVVLALGATSALSDDPARGLADSLERMTGTVTVAAAFIVFVAVRHVVRTPRERTVWLAAAALSSVPVAVVAALQAHGVAVPGLPAAERPVATLGHPAYVGALGLFSVFAGGLVATTSGPRMLRISGALSACAGLVCIVESEARSAVLALFAALYGVLILLALRGRRGGHARRALQWCVSAGMLAAAVVVLLLKSPFAHDVPVVRRLVGVTWATRSVGTRLLAWDASIDAWLERPLAGWGPGGFAQAFEAHYPPALARYGFAETWFDDAHDIVLNTLVEQGVVGALALAALVAVLLRRTTRRTTHCDAPARNTVAAALPFGFVVAHFSDKLLVFEGVVSWTQLALFVALALPPASGDRARPARRTPWMALPAVALAFWIAAASVIPQARAAERAREAAALLGAGDVSASAVLNEALDAAPQHAAEVSRLLVTIARDRLPRLARDGGRERAEGLARHLIERQRAAARDGVRDTLGRAWLVLSLPTLRADGDVLRVVADDLAAAAQRAPRRQEVVFARAEVARARGDARGAELLLDGLRARDPLLPETWLRLIDLALASGRERHAARLARQALSSGARFDARQRALLTSHSR